MRPTSGWLLRSIIFAFVLVVLLVVMSSSAWAGTRYEQTNGNLLSFGTWTTASSASYSGGSLVTADSAASKIAIFNGTQISIIATRGPNYGQLLVAVDAGAPVTVDLFNSSVPAYKSTVWTSPVLASGVHTLRVEYAGTKNVAASATTVNIDAFDVTGTLIARTVKVSAATSLASNTTLSPAYVYVYNGQLSVPVGKTLTILPGTIVKMKYASIAVTANAAGTGLVAKGTVATPVMITSFRDDSLGGDSNGDGVSAGGPADWNGIQVNGGRATIDRAKISYASTGVDALGSTAPVVTMSNSTVKGCYDGLDAIATTVLSLSSNTFSNNTDWGIYLYGLNPLWGIPANQTFNGNGHANAIRVGSGTVSGSKTLPAFPYAYYFETGDVGVATGATLTISAGAKLKFKYNKLTVAATAAGTGLIVNGTSGNPVILTSWNDDSVAGDSNGDGAGTGTPASWTGIVLLTGGRADLDYADVRYASTAIDAQGTSNLALTNSKLQGSYDGLDAAAGAVLSLATNTFSNNTDWGIYLYGLNPLWGIPANQTFTGNGHANAIRVGSGTVSGSKTLPAFPYAYYFETGDVGIPSGATLTISAGAKLKFKYNKLTVAAAAVGTGLIVNGTSGSPVYITSWNDDSIAGDSNGDGATTGSAASWTGIQLLNGRADLKYTRVRFAGTGVDVTGTGNLTATSSTFQGSDYGIEAAATAVLALTTNTFSSNTDWGIYLYGLSPVWGIPANQTFSGNGHANAIRVGPGTVSGAKTLPAFPYAYYFETGDVGVPSGATLTIAAGAKLKFKYNKLTVTANAVGTGLIAKGTNTSPVIFTSWNDDSVAGDSNGDGASTGGASDWNGITITGGRASFDRARVLYASEGLTVSSNINRANVKVLNSVFSYNDTGVDANASDLVIIGNTFKSNVSYGIFNESGLTGSFPDFIVNAAGNYWGTSSGPSTNSSLYIGTGDKINTYTNGSGQSRPMVSTTPFMTYAKSQAYTAWQTFKDSEVKGVWPNVSKGSLLEDMLKKINDPTLVNQKNTPWCGPAAIVHNLLLRDPTFYVNAIKELYETGHLTGKAAVVYTPRDSFITATPPSTTNDPSLADWFLLGALRDASNVLFPAENESAFLRDIAGITFPDEMQEWCKQILGLPTASAGTLYSAGLGGTKGLALKNADTDNLLTKNGAIFLLVDGTIFEDVTGIVPGAHSWYVPAYPNHWIEYDGGLDAVLDPLSFHMKFDWWSWARTGRTSFDMMQFGALLYDIVSGRK